MKRRNQPVYPNTLGLTGKVFQTGECFYSNDLKLLAGYIPTIDNLSSVKNVHSILIVPIFGHQEKKDAKPIAILQFINKQDFLPIEKFDIVSD